MKKQEVKQCENYHYLAEQVGESTAQSCLDGQRSDMLSLPNIRKKSSRKESKTKSLTRPQFSAMSEHSSVKGTPRAIKEWLTLLAVDSHANRSQSQEKEQEAMTAAICGQQRWKLSKSSNRPMCTLRTYLGYSAQQWTTQQGDLFTTLERFSETWPKAGMTADGECWELTMLEQGIIEKDYGLGVYMPTPSTMDHIQPRSKEANDKRFGAGGARANRSAPGTLREWIEPQSWPTPSATDYKGSGKSGDFRDRLDYAVERGATKNKTYQIDHDPLGKLNPDWVEWLMGWPIGATSLEPMSKDTYNEWLNNVETMWDSDPSEREDGRVPRVCDGIKHITVNRLKAIGNGQVSLTMATAYQMLSQKR